MCSQFHKQTSSLIEVWLKIIKRYNKCRKCERVVGLRINQLHQQFVYLEVWRDAAQTLPHTDTHMRILCMHVHDCTCVIMRCVVSGINGHKFKLIETRRQPERVVEREWESVREQASSATHHCTACPYSIARSHCALALSFARRSGPAADLH